MSLFGARRRQPEAARGSLHPLLVDHFLTGEPLWDAPEAVYRLYLDGDRLERLWQEHRAELLAEAKRRGAAPYYEPDALPGLPAWGEHRPDRLYPLGEPAVSRYACPRCGDTDPAPLTCLAPVAGRRARR